VLFIGNSYTSVNDLPATFARLSAALGRTVVTAMIAPGGARLADHLASGEVIARIRDGRWNWVVLQEQSVIPAVEQARRDQMYPAARLLVQEIRRAGARPVFFATWARQAGWPDGDLPDYASMQAQVSDAYRAIGEELNVRVAPVGEGWASIVAEQPQVPMWQADGSHPTPQGTFLAANVLVATIFHALPTGPGVRGDVPEVQATRLQQAAANALPGVARQPVVR
jgi:hypothetical protein